jgi:hypothetical protein
VTNEDGAPIAGARVTLVDASTLATDVEGRASWVDLPGDTATLVVTAQGYLPTQQTVALERGVNQLAIAMQRDPAGLLSSQACASGETLLYVEDFQDGRAQGWFAVDSAPWSFGPDPDNPANLVLTVSGPISGNLPVLQGYVFENAVWRIRVRYDGYVATLLNWRHSFEGGDRRYLVYVRPDFIELGRFVAGGEEGAGSSLRYALSVNTWHQFEIRMAGDAITVALDGQQILSWIDSQPLPPGTIGLHPIYEEGMAGNLYFDNISVCGLP